MLDIRKELLKIEFLINKKDLTRSDKSALKKYFNIILTGDTEEVDVTYKLTTEYHLVLQRLNLVIKLLKKAKNKSMKCKNHTKCLFEELVKALNGDENDSI